MKIKLSELAALPEKEQQKVIEQLVAEARKPFSWDWNSELGQEIRKLESAHGMSTKEMREKISKGEIKETYEICHWLILANCLPEEFK